MIANQPDIEEAFLKLSSYIYFEKQNLHIRKQLADFINVNSDWKKSLRSLKKEIEKYSSNIKRLINKDISIYILPKTVRENDNAFKPKYLFGNFYTNQIYTQPACVEKVAIYIHLPIELHIVSVLWILKYGYLLDKELKKNCLGNRLHIDRSGKVISSRTLFYRYEKQYQKWWHDGISAAKALFDKKEDVTIINFDFKDYYHSIELDFDELTKHLARKGKRIKNDPLHQIFIDIHKKYATLLKQTGHHAYTHKTKLPLPIGMLSSYVLGNYYLKDFDKKIIDEINPVYYGRYVDDLMIVVKNTVIEKFDVKPNEKIEDYGLTLDDKYLLADFYIKKHFNGIFEQYTVKQKRKKGISESESNKENVPVYQVAMEQYINIKLQIEKFFIYQFNANFSPNLLNRFVEEQRERASAFQFLSDDEDDVYKDIDEITFENSFDQSDVNKAKFKNLEDNKYKLSVYLAKLIRGSVISGNKYDLQEAKKVKKYFKGFYLIKNYYFWEKLFAFWIIRREYRFVIRLYNSIQNEISNLKYSGSNYFKSDYNVANNVKVALQNYLEYALLMGLGLYPGLKHHSSLTKGDKDSLEKLGDITAFRKSGLLRKSNLYYPIIHFTNTIKNNRWPLYDSRILDDYINQLDPKNEEIENDLAEVFFPYRIKFYEAAYYYLYIMLGKYNRLYNINLKRKSLDFINPENYLEEAYKIFANVNYIGKFGDPNKVKENYFFFVHSLNSKTYQLPNKNRDIIPTAIHIPHKAHARDNFRICIVNKYVDAVEYEKSLEGTPVNGPKRFEEFNQILDNVKKVPRCDLFIMPELCLPHELMHYYTMQSSYMEIAFITGVEHMKIGNLGFNFILSSYPVNVFGDKDSIPILRLKNHYAPIEEEWIQGKRMIVPKPRPYRYELVQWRNFYLSTYYCYELADIKHRQLFYGMADIIFAPIWNKDMHYYNSLIETASRDMHTYIVLSNTTQYGDTRIIEPSDHIHRDKLRVQGGTVSGYKANILVADLKIKSLRYFQTHDFKAVKDFNEKHKTFFKPLPPDYPFELARLRLKNKLFKL